MRLFLTAITLAIGAAVCSARAQVPVRFPEGSLHGFLELRTDAGALLAHGDLIQTVTDKGLESRMVFHFADTATVFEETVRYTQDGSFAMQEYHLVQRGAVFPFAIDATLSGKAPPDSHAWITTAGAPAFVKFVGPLYLGATWQLTLAAPSPPGAE